MTKLADSYSDSGGSDPSDPGPDVHVVTEIFTRAREIHELARRNDLYLIDYLIGLVEAEAHELLAKALPEELDKAEQTLLKAAEVRTSAEADSV